ncbi:fibronectin type III domain-containing protein [Peribacillus sp. TH16]|uniref:fibronectin type III domain-containing protein n=1 Tax=Peribacillus sp. TH16 TaxID=2798482 RepID=UPI0019138233|nr:fibronectin type III domain-containing protein [Peribacillus sp. TH16]MBK5482943.1 fibronectin type III domain-containing protein [Peribacillus sp. TH16]MBK5482961.1 fibronectin type III domain-containing protein [Peribacillus sp. TH16]
MRKIFPLLLIIFIFLVPFSSNVFAYDDVSFKQMNNKQVLNIPKELKSGDKVTLRFTSGSQYVSGALYIDSDTIANASSKEIVVKATNNLNITSYDAVVTSDYSPSFNIFSNADTSLSIKLYAVLINGVEIFDGNKIIVPRKHDEIKNPLSTVTDKSFSLTWDTPISNDGFVQTNVYKNGTKIANLSKEIDVYKDDDVLPNTSYTYKLTAVYDDGFETNGVSVTDITLDAPPDPSLIPPSNVTDLTVSNITDVSLDLDWLNPDDDDLDKIKIYKNNVLLESILVASSYKVTGLTPNTSYTFSVSAVDKDGNEGSKQTTTAKTLDGIDKVAPVAPTGLSVESGNKALFVRWNKNLEDDLFGYNVYLDGIKQNMVPVKNTFYSLADLENGTQYKVKISAVDTTGNESDMTSEKIGIPLDTGMPLLDTNYELGDVAKGIESWFSSLWLIIAFAIAIPLSFYIASRIKLMFLE